MHYQNVLLGSAIALSLVFGFAGCSSEDDDDEEGAISGSNNDYTVSYTNSSSDAVYRAYNTTTFKHRGALCQITIKSGSDTGAMGYMWDLESNSSRTRTARAPRTFLIAGFNYNNTKSGEVAYYVSRYQNVVDIEAYNFGAGSTTEAATAQEYEGTSYTAAETEYIALSSSNAFAPTKDADGNVVVTIDVYEDGDWSWNDKKTKRTYTSYNGGYCVDFYNGAVTLAEIGAETAAEKKITLSSVSNEATEGSTATGHATVTNGTLHIPASDLGYGNSTTTSASHVVSEFQGAVYTNVYAGSTLNGSWHYERDYSEAEEVVEE